MNGLSNNLCRSGCSTCALCVGSDVRVTGLPGVGSEHNRGSESFRSSSTHEKSDEQDVSYDNLLSSSAIFSVTALKPRFVGCSSLSHQSL